MIDNRNQMNDNKLNQAAGSFSHPTDGNQKG